jgi:hypothetical protein
MASTELNAVDEMRQLARKLPHLRVRLNRCSTM